MNTAKTSDVTQGGVRDRKQHKQQLMMDTGEKREGTHKQIKEGTGRNRVIIIVANIWAFSV